jgi:hypothetical protein
MTPEVRNGAGQSAASNVLFLRPDNLKHTNPPQKLQVARIADDPVMQTAFQKVYDQGPRMVLELLSALAEKNIQAMAVEKEIKRFALLPPGALRAIGCDRIKPFYPLEVPQ